MKKLLAIWVFCLFLSLPVLAQDLLSSFKDRIQALNQTQLTFSPTYKSEDEIFAMRVVNPMRQIVGRVNDVRLDESGAIASLVSEITNVGRNERIVENPGYEVTFHFEISAYEIPLGFSENTVASVEELAAIEPAAGGGTVYSLRSLLGADVRANSGKRVGMVEHVIFSDQGDTVVAFILEDVPGTGRYKEIAIPFDPQLMAMRSDYGRVEVRIDNTAAQVITEYARSNR